MRMEGGFPGYVETPLPTRLQSRSKWEKPACPAIVHDTVSLEGSGGILVAVKTCPAMSEQA